KAVDRLSIVAHDRFQEIIDEANRPDSAIRLEKLILDPSKDFQKLATVVSQAGVLAQLGGQPVESSSPSLVVKELPDTIFVTEAEQKVANAAYQEIQRCENLANSKKLLSKEVQKKIVEAVETAVAPTQEELEGIVEKPDVADIVSKVT